MKKRRYWIACLLIVVSAVGMTVYFLVSQWPLTIIPPDAHIIRPPNSNRVAYVFPADFNSVVAEATVELGKLGFQAGNAPFDDPCEVIRFSKTHTDGRVHDIEIYNKKLGSVGQVSIEEGWVSVLIYEEDYLDLRKKMFFRKIRQWTSRSSHR